LLTDYSIDYAHGEGTTVHHPAKLVTQTWKTVDRILHKLAQTHRCINHHVRTSLEYICNHVDAYVYAHRK